MLVLRLMTGRLVDGRLNILDTFNYDRLLNGLFLILRVRLGKCEQVASIHSSILGGWFYMLLLVCCVSAAWLLVWISVVYIVDRDRKQALIRQFL